MLGETEACLLGRVRVVERLDGVATPLGLRAQPHGLVPDRIGVVAPVHFDLEKGRVLAADGDPHRLRISRWRKVPQHDRVQTRLQDRAA